MNEISNRQSLTFWNMKAFAVVAIVACHCCHVAENAGAVNRVTVTFFSYWISYGVPVFYFIAGFFFKADDGVVVFWKKKLKTIIIPWIFTGTVVWCYVAFRKGGMTIENWFKFLFMRDSYLYFLTDLICFYLVFCLIRNWKGYLVWIGGILTLLTIYGEVARIPLLIDNIPGHGLPIVNLWIFYVGVVARKYMLCKFFQSIKSSSFIILFIVIRTCQLYIWRSSVGIIINIVCAICFLIALYSICYIMSENEHRLIEKVGKNSFSIYLLHMPVAGIVANVLNRSEWFALFTFWRPMIVIGITIVMIQWYTFIVRKKRNWLMLIGMRLSMETE